MTDCESAKEKESKLELAQILAEDEEAMVIYSEDYLLQLNPT